MWSLKAYLWLLVVLALSGLALTLMYVPVAAPIVSAHPAQPGRTAGGFTRGVHFWVAQMAVLAVLAHLVWSLLVKTNRRLTGWAASLFVLTGLLAFTGFLLPWDALENWLDRTGTGLTLMRFYVLHVLLLPLLLYPLAVVYFRRTRRETPMAMPVSP